MDELKKILEEKEQKTPEEIAELNEIYTTMSNVITPADPDIIRNALGVLESAYIDAKIYGIDEIFLLKYVSLIEKIKKNIKPNMSDFVVNNFPKEYNSNDNDKILKHIVSSVLNDLYFEAKLNGADELHLQNYLSFLKDVGKEYGIGEVQPLSEEQKEDNVTIINSNSDEDKNMIYKIDINYKKCSPSKREYTNFEGLEENDYFFLGNNYGCKILIKKVYSDKVILEFDENSKFLLPTKSKEIEIKIGEEIHPYLPITPAPVYEIKLVNIRKKIRLFES